MSPPKQFFRVVSTHTELTKPLEYQNNVVKVDESSEEYRLDSVAVYDFDRDEIALNEPDIPEDDESVVENEFTNGALPRYSKAAHAKTTDCDGYHANFDEDAFNNDNFDEDVDGPSPFFSAYDNDDGDFNNIEEFEDGEDFIEDNELEYYCDDDCW